MKNKFELFEQIRNNQSLPFPFDESELYDLVKNIEPNKFNKEIKFFEPVKANMFKKLMQSKKGVIMSGIISLLVVSILSVFTINNYDFENQNDNTKIKNGTTFISLNQLQKSENIQEETVGKKIIDEIQDEGSRKPEQVVNSSNILELFKQNEEIKNKIEIPFILLTHKELEKLGINQNENGLEFRTEMAYSIDENKNIAKKIIEKKYPSKGIALKQVKVSTIGDVLSDNFLEYLGWNNKNPEGIYPVSYVCRNDKVGTHNINTLDRAILSKEMDKYIRLGLTEFANQLIHLMIKVSEISDDNRLLFIETDLHSYPLLKQFIPIYIRNEGAKFEYAYVLWFPNTKKFLSKLPLEYSKFYQQYSSTNGLLVPNKETIELADKYVQEIKPKEEVKKIIPQYEKLSLTQEEMNKIGILKNNNKYEVIFEQKASLQNAPKDAKVYISKLNYDTSLTQIMFRMYEVIDTSNIEGTPIIYTNWDHINYCKTFPVCITLHNWIQSRNKEKTGEKLIVSDSERSPILDSSEKNVDIIEIESDSFQVKIDKLIPVRINFGFKKDTSKMAENETNNYSEVDIWFYANREFVNLLPERYKEKLLKELELIDNVEDGLITTEQACEILKGESFFDFCGKSNETLKKLSVFPNPVINKELVIKFDLIKDSEISIDLYDLEGKLIRNLIEKSSFTKGNFSRMFNLDVSNGIYLIDIKTNSGSIFSKIMKY